MSSRTYFLAGALIALILLGAIGAALILNQPYTFQGSLISNPKQAADFTLTDQLGQPFRLSDQRGKVVLIFFGYTHCPDVCPVTLVEYKDIRARLGRQADLAVFLFVTVDPARDNVEVLKAHLANFDPAIIGLTADEATLEPVYQAYGIVHQKQEVGSAAGYLMDHTARMYGVDRQGNLRLTFPYGFPVEDIVKDVTYLIQEPGRDEK